MPNDVINTITINNNTYDIGGTGCGKAINMTLSANSWDANNRQSLQFSGYRSGQSGVIGMPTSVTSAQKSAYQNADISIYSQSSDTFTFECGGTVPSIDLPVSLFITDLGGGSGGSGGHTIEDADGTDMTQRTNLQFLDAGVTDDSTDDVTKIENVQVIDDEDDLEDAPDGIYMGDWDDADAVIDASIVGYDNTDSGLEATDVQGAVDELASNKVDAVQGKGLSTNDYDNTDKAKVDKINETTQSATGNPISISGLKSNQLAIDPIITLEPIQAGSGTPSPSNVRAISGYDKIEVLSCGVNIWDEEWEVGSIGNNTGENETDSANIRSKDFNVIKPATTYYCKVASGYIRIHYYDANKNWISGNSLSNGGGVFTVPNNSNIKYFRIRTTNSYGSTYQNDIGINYPATQTSYVASNKTTSISESLGQTVYWASDDVRTGDLSNLGDAVDLGSLTWSYRASGSTYLGIFSTTGITGYLKSAVADALCEIYNNIGGIGGLADMNSKPTGSFGFYAVNDNNYVLYIKDTSYSDETTFKNAVTGYKITFKKETTSHIQHTPHEISLLKDYAYVSTNGTNITFDYHNGELASLGDVSQLGETVERQQFHAYSSGAKKIGTWIDGSDVYEEVIVLSGETTIGNALTNVYQYTDDMKQTDCPIECFGIRRNPKRVFPLHVDMDTSGMFVQTYVSGAVIKEILVRFIR